MIKNIVVGLFAALLMIGCVPPGQVKKNAAPGQVMKNTGYNPASGKFKCKPKWSKAKNNL